MQVLLLFSVRHLNKYLLPTFSANKWAVHCDHLRWA